MSEARLCSNCGEPVSDGKFCANCGARTAFALPPTVGASVNTITRTNTLAIVALVVSWFIPFIGMFLAYTARKQIAASNGAQTGRLLTTVAILLNWVWIAAIVATLALFAL